MKSTIKIEKLIIERFRAFYPLSSLSLGDKITLIAGQNGTSKSTILGMLSQPLGFPNRKKVNSKYTTAYHGLDLQNYKTFTGKYFKAEYSEIFRMSKNFDIAGQHKYSIFLSGKAIVSSSKIMDSGLTVTSEIRTDQKTNHLRFVTNSESRTPGEGNFPHPVIYLGLERLRPLAKCDKVVNEASILESEDKMYMEKCYKRILNALPEDNITSEKIDTGNAKGFYQSIKTTEYDSIGASAGQDNIGQILTAIISFRKLKRDLGENYQGGLLLVDELDASLHTVSQEILFKVLFEACNELSLQLVATTHSLNLLKYANDFQPPCAKIVYLRKRRGKIHIIDNVDYEFIKRDLAHIRDTKNALVKQTRTTILFEDNVASEFFKQITCGIFNKYIKIHSNPLNNKYTSLSDSVLLTLAKSKIPEFRKIIYILDPDGEDKVNIPDAHILSLPGHFPIEILILKFLSSIPDDDPIWETDIDCTKQECFKDFVLNCDHPKIEYAKKWFNYCKRNNFFGNNNRRIFRLWKDYNINEAKSFCSSFLEKLKNINNKYAIDNYDQLMITIEEKFKM